MGKIRRKVKMMKIRKKKPERILKNKNPVMMNKKDMNKRNSNILKSIPL